MTVYNEKELILRKFKQNFSQYKDQPIVLYGTGKNTEAILRECGHDFCIAGVMDVKKEKEIFCGRKVLTLQQVKELCVNLIVLICLPVSEDIVYERIRDFTEKAQIRVFNLDGIEKHPRTDGHPFPALTDKEKEKMAETGELSALFRHTIYFDLERDADTWMKNKMLDFFVKELLNDSMGIEKDGRVFIADPAKIGYLYWGPVFTGFLLWMVRAAMSDSCDVILFQSRDGYLLQKMYGILKDTYKKEVQFPADIYFLTSRRSSSMARIRTEEDIRVAAEYPWNGTTEMFMERRFGVHVDSEELSDMDCGQCAIKYKENIFERAREERSNYNKYLNSLNLQQYQRAALIDTTAAGTVQTNLQHFMELPMKGYYFLKRVSAVEENNLIDVQSYYPSKCSYEIKENVYKNFRIMELVLSSRQSTLVCFDKDGKPEYAKEKMSEEEKNMLEGMQQGVLRYFKDICNMGLEWERLELDKDFADEILGRMNDRYIIMNDTRIKNLVLEDYFCNVEKQAFV